MVLLRIVDWGMKMLTESIYNGLYWLVASQFYKKVSYSCSCQLPNALETFLTNEAFQIQLVLF